MTRKQWFLLSTLIALQLCDLLSTRFAISHGAVELNPLVRSVGLWQSKLAVCGMAVLLVLRGRVWAMYVVGGAYVLIVGWNLHLLIR